MIEDVELNALLKEALEENGAFAYRPRRLRSMWGVPALLAAGLAIAVAWRVWSPVAKTDPLAEAIGFLADVDGLEASIAVDGVELLAAWQAAPLESFGYTE